MARPAGNTDPSQFLSPSRTFFVITKISLGRPLLQSERNVMLLIDVLRSYVAARRFQLHDFVLMPNPVHLLIAVSGNMTIERSMQLIQRGLSFRLGKEFGYLGEVWQRGFAKARIRDRQSFLRYRREPREGGAGGFAGEVSLFDHLFGKSKEAGAKARELVTWRAARLKPCPAPMRNEPVQALLEFDVNGIGVGG